jgi:hypothetical protein
MKEEMMAKIAMIPQVIAQKTTGAVHLPDNKPVI